MQNLREGMLWAEGVISKLSSTYKDKESYSQDSLCRRLSGSGTRWLCDWRQAQEFRGQARRVRGSDNGDTGGMCFLYPRHCPNTLHGMDYSHCKAMQG